MFFFIFTCLSSTLVALSFRVVEVGFIHTVLFTITIANKLASLAWTKLVNQSEQRAMRMKWNTDTGLPVKILANKVVFDFSALLKILTQHPTSMKTIRKFRNEFEFVGSRSKPVSQTGLLVSNETWKGILTSKSINEQLVHEMIVIQWQIFFLSKLMSVTS